MAKKKKYTLTPEHRARLPEWRDEWIANAMSTAAMTEDDRERCRDAVRRLYEAAGLKAPPPHRIVFVPSPFVATYAGGFAAWVWHQRKAGKSAAGQLPRATAMRETTAQHKTEARTVTATRVRTEVAIDAETRLGEASAETWGATVATTWAATARPTSDAVEDAVFAPAPLHRVAAQIGAAAGKHATNVRPSTTPGTTTETLRGTDIPVGRAVAPIEDATVDALEEATRRATERATRDTAMIAVDDLPFLISMGERGAAAEAVLRPVAGVAAPWTEATLHAVSDATRETVNPVGRATNLAAKRDTVTDAWMRTYHAVDGATDMIGWMAGVAVLQATDHPAQATDRAARNKIMAAGQNTTISRVQDAVETGSLLHGLHVKHDVIGRTDAATLDPTWVAVSEATWAATEGAATTTALNPGSSAASLAKANDATWRAGEAATQNAQADAAHGATRNEAWTIIRQPIEDAQQPTTIAILSATYQAAGGSAMPVRIAGPDLSRWWIAPNVHEMAALCGVGTPGVQCAQAARNMWQGGNQWSGYAAYLSFFRHVAQLPIDYTAWDAWETLARLSGPRIVHEDFCIISDRPELLTVDDEHRPHAEHGPFCRWRDGTALYSWHGVRIPAKWIEDRSTLTAAEALSEENLEVRRAACEIIGWDRILSDLNATTIDRDADPQIGELVEVDLPDSGRERFLRVVCGTGRRFAIPVPPTVQTALEANAWTYGLEPHEYNPEFRT